MLFSNSHEEWEDFFKSSIEHKLYTNESKRLELSSSRSYYISRCLFIYLNQAGAVRISDTTNSNLKFLIDVSSFDKCEHKSADGGSLFINSTNCECIQDRICSSGSNTPSYGAHCYVIVSKTPPFKNYLLDSTIYSSGDENKLGQINVDLSHGEINMKSNNISFSKLFFRNFYSVYYLSNSNVTFSTFSNNTSKHTGNFEALYSSYYDSFEFKILFCNYVENECYWFISSIFDLYVYNCSFSRNLIKGKFMDANRMIQIKGCYIDMPDPSTTGSVSIIENANSMYPGNRHLSSYKCYAELKLEFLDEGKSKSKEKVEIKINYKQIYNLSLIIYLTSLISK